MAFLEQLPIRAARAPRRIVLAEGDEERVRDAALRLAEAGGLEPVVLIADAAIDMPVDWGGEVRRPADDDQLGQFAEVYRETPQGNQLTLAAARDEVRDPLRFAGMMVRTGAADGAVAGAVHATPDVIRAALRCIGAAPGVSTVNGAFYMVVPAFRGEGGGGGRGGGADRAEVLTFADSGVVPDPSAAQLAEIAAQAAEMRGRIVGDEPRVAFLSYSTCGSAAGPSVEKMREALSLFRDAHPDVAADGEFQVDAALMEDVGRRKAPGSAVAGRANVLIFPDLDAGNIAYKLVERLAGATAIGPILHGLARPFNDLSRGASAADVEWVAYVTALMASDLDS